MICSSLASLCKSLLRSMKVFEDLWRSLYCENSNPLSILKKRHHRRCWLGFHIRICFLKTPRTFYHFFIRLLKSVKSYFFLSSNQQCWRTSLIFLTKHAVIYLMKRRFHFYVAAHVMCPWSFMLLTSLH